jgi:hypothetical protein
MASPGRRVWLAVLLLAAGGCSGGGLSPETVRAWVGRPVTSLEQAWGPATRETRDGGRRLLIYEEVEKTSQRDLQSPVAPRYAPPGTVYEPNVRVYVRSYLFWVNPDGTIGEATRRDP